MDFNCYWKENALENINWYFAKSRGFESGSIPVHVFLVNIYLQTLQIVDTYLFTEIILIMNEYNRYSTEIY